MARAVPSSPFERWRDRFHREDFAKSSNFVVFLLRPTFDRLRIVSKSDDNKREKSEMEIIKLIKDTLLNYNQDREWYIKHGQLAETVDQEQDPINLTGAFLQSSGKNNNDGLVILFPPIEFFSGELQPGKIPIIIHFEEDKNAVRWISSKDNKKSISLSNISKLNKDEITNSDEYFVDINDGDLRESKLLPTDLLMRNKEDSVRDTLQTLRRLLAEIRVTDRGGQPSEEQAKAMNKFDLGISPILNITGRPGTGKTTVAQIAAAEAALQKAGSSGTRSDRRVLYVTTTGNLKSEAYEEIHAIMKSVYALNDTQVKQFMPKINVLTRDDLIRELPQQDRRLDNQIMSKILEEALNKIKHESPQKFGRINQSWNKENSGELFRVIQNFVYGIFGSISNFILWYNQTPQRAGFNPSNAKGWYEVFHNERILNLVDPLTDSLPTGRSQFRLFRVWNPYPKSENEKVSKGDLERGYEKLRDLKELLEVRHFSSKLFDESLSGNWTYAAVLDYLSTDERRKNFRAKDNLWKSSSDGGSRNSFDVIIIDESQDFTVREISCILKIFSRRTKLESSSYFPFSLVCTGDPLQTIEGSIFNAKHSHINAVYEDWKQYLAVGKGDRGLRDPDHTELKANYRNAAPIVRKVLNPVISKMNEYDKRTISQQRAAFHRKGVVLRGGPEEFNSKEINIHTIALNRLFHQIKNRLQSKQDNKIISSPTTALIVPRLSRNDLEKTMDDNGVWNYKPPDENKSIGDLIEELIDEENPIGEVYRQVLNDSGIFDIEGIKGRTVQVAIVLDFANNAVKAIQEGESDSESLLRLSHLLVASSRPQFALLIHDSEKMELSTLEIEYTPSEAVQSDEIRKLIEIDTIDYNPSEFFSRAMDSAFIAFRKSEEHGKPDQFSWSIATRASKESKRGMKFVDFCKGVHDDYHNNALFDRIQKLRDLSDDEIIDLQVSANEIDQSSCWVIEGDDKTRDGLLNFLKWKYFVEYSDSQTGLVEHLQDWVDWVNESRKRKPEDKFTKKILDDNLNFSPFHFLESEKIAPKCATRDNCNYSCEVPHRWVFGDMVMESVYTTKYSDMRELLIKNKPKKGKSQDTTTHWKNWLSVRWFLASSHLKQEIHRNADLRDDLIEIAREAIERDEKFGLNIIDWMIIAIENDLLNEEFRNQTNKSPIAPTPLFEELHHWCSSSSFRATLISEFSKWMIVQKEEKTEDWEREVLNVGQIFINRYKDLRKDIDPENDLKKFWSDLIYSPDVLKMIENWYEEYLNKLVKKLRSSSITESEIIPLLQRLSTINQIFEINSQPKDPNPEIVTRIQSMIGLINAYRDSKSSNYAIRQLLEEWNVDEEKSTFWKPFSNSIDFKFTSIILGEFLEAQGGGFFGPRLIKKRRIKDINIINNIIFPLTIFNEKQRNRYLRKLRIFAHSQSNYYLELLFEDSVRLGGRSDASEDPALKFILALASLQNDENKYMKNLLDWHSKNQLNQLKARRDSKEWDKRLIYREGINFWNYLSHPKFPTYYRRILREKLSVSDGCLYKDLPNIPVYYGGNVVPPQRPKDPILSRFARIPMPSIKDSDTSESGSVNPFCNNNPGIIAYNDIYPRNGSFTKKELIQIRGNFRRSGCYREAAVMDLILAILGHQDSKEMIQMALQERAGIFHDQVTISRRWEFKGSGRGTKVELQTDLLSMLSLQPLDSKILPLVVNPIGRIKYDNHIRSPFKHDSLKLLPKIPFTISSEHTSNVRYDIINDLIDFRNTKKNLLRAKESKKLDNLNQFIANLIASTRSLIPYLVLSLELKNSNKIIQSVDWFKSDDTKPDAWEIEIESLDRSILIDDLQKEDQWLYSLYVKAMESSKFEIDPEELIESLPSSNLVHMTKVLLGRISVEELEESNRIKFEDLEEKESEKTIESITTVEVRIEKEKSQEICENCSKDLSLLLSIPEINLQFCPQCGTEL